MPKFYFDSTVRPALGDMGKEARDVLPSTFGPAQPSLVHVDESLSEPAPDLFWAKVKRELNRM